jgi:hypothetical protein
MSLQPDDAALDQAVRQALVAYATSQVHTKNKLIVPLDHLVCGFSARSAGNRTQLKEIHDGYQRRILG